MLQGEKGDRIIEKAAWKRSKLAPGDFEAYGNQKKPGGPGGNQGQGASGDIERERKSLSIKEKR